MPQDKLDEILITLVCTYIPLNDNLHDGVYSDGDISIAKYDILALGLTEDEMRRIICDAWSGEVEEADACAAAEALYEAGRKKVEG